MKQRLDPRPVLNDRPEREDVIEKDEIIGMIIDLETMSPEMFFSNYFSAGMDKPR